LGGSSFFSSGTSGMPNRVLGLFSAAAAASSGFLSLSLCLSAWCDGLSEYLLEEVVGEEELADGGES
jgi:hypothetical protein